MAPADKDLRRATLHCVSSFAASGTEVLLDAINTLNAFLLKAQRSCEYRLQDKWVPGTRLSREWATCRIGTSLNTYTMHHFIHCIYVSALSTTHSALAISMVMLFVCRCAYVVAVRSRARHRAHDVTQAYAVSISFCVILRDFRQKEKKKLPQNTPSRDEPCLPRCNTSSMVGSADQRNMAALTQFISSAVRNFWPRLCCTCFFVVFSP